MKKHIIFKRNILFVILNLLLLTSILGQNILNLSKNTNENHVSIKGMPVSIDTAGLHLNISSDPKVFINEKDKTVLSFEQKMVSIEDYKSIMNKMLKYDSIISEYKVIFNDFSGKVKLGLIDFQNVEKEFWICYLGNKDYVIEVKGYYDSELKRKYRAAFEKAIKSLYLNTSNNISIYEDLPFYLDEVKFPYKKEMSFMPQSILISKYNNGSKRIVSLSYLKASNKEIEGLKQEYFNDADKKIIEGREVILKTIRTGNKIKLVGIITKNNQILNINCISSESDESAISEFEQIAKSIRFKQ